jgi:hypothetical protein
MQEKHTLASVSVVTLMLWTVGVSLVVSRITGCTAYCDRESSDVIVRGKVVDAETLEGLTRANVDVRTVTNGEETGSRNVRIRLEDGAPPAAEAGSFDAEIGYRQGRVEICPWAPPPPIPEFPRPDRLEVIVLRSYCRFEFVIGINEDTVVDMTFPDDVIELRDPILVPACHVVEVP